MLNMEIQTKFPCIQNYVHKYKIHPFVWPGSFVVPRKEAGEVLQKHLEDLEFQPSVDKARHFKFCLTRAPWTCS